MTTWLNTMEAVRVWIQRGDFHRVRMTKATASIDDSTVEVHFCGEHCCQDFTIPPGRSLVRTVEALDVAAAQVLLESDAAFAARDGKEDVQERCQDARKRWYKEMLETAENNACRGKGGA